MIYVDTESGDDETFDVEMSSLSSHYLQDDGRGRVNKFVLLFFIQFINQ